MLSPHPLPNHLRLFTAKMNRALFSGYLLVVLSLFPSAFAQDPIAISAESLDQVATNATLDLACLKAANPDVDKLAPGDTFLVPLTCCGTQSFTCSQPFCIQKVECSVDLGVDTIDNSSVAAPPTLTASIPPDGTKTTDSVDTGGGLVSAAMATTVQSSSTDAAGVVVPVTTEPSPDPDAPDPDPPAADTPDADTPGGDTPKPDAPNTGAPRLDAPDPDTPDPDTPDPDTSGADSPDAASLPPTEAPSVAPTDDPSSTTTEESSTSFSSVPPNSPTAYLLSTKTDTDKAAFEKLIKTLPDEGKGAVISYPNIPWQSYSTNLTEDQAVELRKNAIVEFVARITEEDGEARAVSSEHPSHHEKRADEDETDEDSNAKSPRPNSEYHLGMLSADPKFKDKIDWGEYTFDTSLGEGAWIYVLDTGYRASHEVIATVQSHVGSSVTALIHARTLRTTKPESRKESCPMTSP